MVLPLACLLPGQGAQSQGMLCDSNHTIIQRTILEAQEALGLPLWDIVRSDSGRLNQTEITQPAILTASIALWRLWRSLRPQAKPTILAGHSLGEYTALVCANSIDFTDAVKIVHERGRLMQSVVPEGEGAMAAILGLSDEQVESLCNQTTKKVDKIVSAANYNSPGQVVIAGHRCAVLLAIEAAQEAGAKRSVLLPVSVPSHCELMVDITEAFSNTLSRIEIRPPDIPVIHNATTTTLSHPDDIRGALVNQLTRPVYWTKTIEKIAALPVKTMVECGPGKVLTGLVKRINRAFSVISVYDENSLFEALSVLEEEI